MRKPLEAIDRSVAIDPDRGPQASALGRPLLAHRDTHMAHTQGRTRKHLGPERRHLQTMDPLSRAGPSF